MEENNFEDVSYSESELSTIDEGQYTNIPTSEINIDTPSEYSPTENYLYSYTFNSIQNEIDEAPLTLPIEYLSTAREILISLVMMREQTSNEALTFTNPSNNINASSLSEPSSVSMDNFMLSGNETWLDPQLQNYTFPSFLETPSQLSLEQLPSLSSLSLEQDISTDQSIITTTQNTYIEPMDNIVFDDIDQIIAHSRRFRNGHRIMNMLCTMTNGEQRWIPVRHLRKDSRVSKMMDRYYRDLKYPYWAKRTKNSKRKW
jgi:hypothetical protein